MRKIALLALMCSAGCATGTGAGPGSRTKSGFPSASALKELAATPKPTIADGTNYVDPVQWDLPGPFPDSAALMIRQGTQPWDALLTESLKPSAGMALPSTAMHCVAQAIAEFFVDHGTYPSFGAQTFALGRCQATPSHIQISSYGGEVPDSIDNEALYAQWKDSLRKILGTAGTSKLESVGLGFSRKDGKVYFTVVRGERRAFLEPVVIEGDHAVVKGRLLVPDANVRASINHGAFGYADCIADVTVQIPEFKLHCPVNSTDSSAWIQVASFAPERLLGKSAATLLIAPSGALSPTFLRRVPPGANIDVTAANFAQTFLEAVNATRQQAGLAPLQAAPKQSEVANQLTPHFFKAHLDTKDSNATEMILMGMRAGWQIPGMVRYGNFSAVASVGTRKLDVLLGTLLEMPFGRQTVLDPKVRKIAMGTMMGDTAQFMGALLSTYAFFGDESPKALAMGAFAKLNKQRAEAGLTPATRITGLGDGQDRATELLSSGQSPDNALSSLLATATRKLKIGVSGYRLEMNRLDDLEWPATISTRANLSIHISVGWYQPEGEPWGRYVVFCVYPGGEREAI